MSGSLMNTLEGVRTAHNNSVLNQVPPLILSKHQHFTSIDNLTKQQRKHPQIKQILRGMQYSNFCKQDSHIYGCNSIQGFIQTSIQKEHLRKKNLSKIISEVIKRPEISDKGYQRFQLFKEQIREKLHGSDEYIFSETYKQKYGNPLLKIDRNASVEDAQHYYSKQQHYNQAKLKMAAKLSDDIGIDLSQCSLN